MSSSVNQRPAEDPAGEADTAPEAAAPETGDGGAASATGSEASPGSNGAGAEAPAGGGEDAAVGEETGEELDPELAEARREIEKHREALLRVRAEMENLRRRTAREVESAHRYGVESLVAELLPVFDSMELGLGAAADGEPDATRLREGMELTLKMLLQAAEKFGLRPVDPAGEAFDPEFHQAMSVREEAGVESGTVLQVVQKGYLLHERLVRPAMVIVAK